MPPGFAAHDRYWAMAPDELLRRLGSSAEGLSSDEAEARLRHYGPNAVSEHAALTRLAVLTRQFKSPLLLLLVFAAAASLLTGEWIDAGIVLAIVVVTVGIGYSREYSAQSAAAALGSRVHGPRAGPPRRPAAAVTTDQIVPGDVVLLSAGSLVPADGVLLEATDFFVSEAAADGRELPGREDAGRGRRRRRRSPTAPTASSSARTSAAAPPGAWSSTPAPARSSARSPGA